MANKIQIKRGIKNNLPILNNGEFGLCTDTKELFIGNNSSNINILDENKIVNDVTTGGTKKVLSAEQGKTLNTGLNGLKNRFDKFIGTTIILSEYQNVSDYGSLINGLISDGTKDYVIVCESNKEYRFLTPLIIKGKIKIVGNDSLWRYMGTSDTFITFQEGDWQIEGSIIQDLVIWCNEKSVGAYQAKYCFVVQGNHITIKFNNLKIYNFGYVWLMKDTDIKSSGFSHYTFGHSITECNVWGFITVINSQGNSEQLYICHNWFDDGLRTEGSQNSCIRISDATSIWIRDNIIQNCDIGINLRGVKCGVIEGNHFENMIDSSVSLNPSGVYENINTSISNNWLVGHKGCIRFYAPSNGNKSIHNTIFNNCFGFLGESASACVTGNPNSEANTIAMNNKMIDGSWTMFSSTITTLKEFQ